MAARRGTSAARFNARSEHVELNNLPGLSSGQQVGFIPSNKVELFDEQMRDNRHMAQSRPPLLKTSMFDNNGEPVNSAESWST